MTKRRFSQDSESDGIGVRTAVRSYCRPAGDALNGKTGLAFRAVAVVACDENVLPLAARVADVADEFALDEVIATERQLMYVAATQARDRLFVSGLSRDPSFSTNCDKDLSENPAAEHWFSRACG